MKEWVLSVSGIIILTAVISVLLPNGKTGKLIKSVFSVMCLLVFIRPVLSLKNADFSFENFFKDGELGYQTSYLYYVYSDRVKRAEEGCENYLKEECKTDADVSVLYYIGKDEEIVVKKIQIYIKNSVIEKKDEHIDIIGKANEYLLKYFVFDLSAIEIYE